MIDIIIPAYNSSDSIIGTLASIAIQRIKDKAKIYIIDDCSSDDYSKVLSLFEDKLDITYIRLDKNMGPGYARQVGIDSSNSEYIVFIDSDDQFYNCYSLELLYDSINDNTFDMVMGYYYIESDSGRELVDKIHIGGCLHGKIYRRKHLVDNNIRFNNSRYSEDNSFHTLFSYTSNNFAFIEEIIYVYKYNSLSLTNNKDKFIKINCSYLHNMLWVINNLEKRKIDKKDIIHILINSYVYIYNVVKDNKNKDFSKLYKYCASYEEKYIEYEKYIDDDLLLSYMSPKDLLGFKKFRKKFKSR